MPILYPLLFEPRFQERVWGGRQLEKLFGKKLPPGVPIGESWEVSDRADDESVIRNGPFEGRTLRWLIENHGQAVLGRELRLGERFPLLIKLLDASDTLSLQVHPPAHIAAQLNGEPKTEMWYVAQAEPGAKLYAGLRRGVTQAEFERKINDGSVAECFHQLPVRAGDALFLPSGRVHAIGKGLVIFEIQQNSDTTFRVFDWNRKGLDGKPRQLHIADSLRSIDFQDFEPSLVSREIIKTDSGSVRPLVRDPLFQVDIHTIRQNRSLKVAHTSAMVVGVVRGSVSVEEGSTRCEARAGDFSLIPACCECVLRCAQDAELLLVYAGCS